MKEFRIALQNEPGQLHSLVEALGEKLVNIRTIAGIAESDPKIAFVVDQEDLMRATLQGKSIPFEENDLLSIQLPDQAGEISKLTKELSTINVNINSIYLLDRNAGTAELAFTTDNMTEAKLALGL